MTKHFLGDRVHPVHCGELCPSGAAAALKGARVGQVKDGSATTEFCNPMDPLSEICA